MEFRRESWAQSDYGALMEVLLYDTEEKMRKFNQKLLPGVENILGIRLPALRAIAKQIACGNYREYFDLCQANYHEEIMLWGMVIGHVSCDFADLTGFVADFIPHITNWAVCDSFCMGLKVFQKHPFEAFRFVESYQDSKNPWALRFMLVCFLAHFIKEESIDRVLYQSGCVRLDAYYVRMANAWLVSAAYVHYPDKTLSFLQSGVLDGWTFHKAIQKIVESNRVDSQQKEMLRQMR